MRRRNIITRREENNMAEKKTNGTNRVHKGRTTLAYVVLIILSFLCLFFFYVLLVNATRNHFQIQKGFSFVPGKSLVRNLKAVLNDANIPVVSGIKNSLIVSVCTAALSTYFSAMTAYGLYADPGNADTGICTWFR